MKKTGLIILAIIVFGLLIYFTFIIAVIKLAIGIVLLFVAAIILWWLWSKIKDAID